MQSPGKRWTTTTSTSLQEVAERRNHAGANRETDLKTMRDRKVAMSKTSIRFGNDKTPYVSTTMDNAKYVSFDPSERAEQVARAQKMKADLTVTNFRLGDASPVYETTTARALNQASGGLSGTYEAKQLSEAMKAIAKRSSLHFGNESTAYNTSAHDAMEYKGSSSNYSALKEEVGKMSKTLRQCNFTLGDEKTSYETDYNRGFGSVNMDAYRNKGDSKARMKETIDNARSYHFSFGQDSVQYKTTAHTQLDDCKGGGFGDREKSKSDAMSIKKALQRTSIVIGDDQDYM